MAQIPPGRLTRQQIRDRALTAAGNRSLDAEAVTWLSSRLYDLATLWDWPFLNTATTVALGRVFALPADYYQAQDDEALQITTLDGRPFFATVRETDRATIETVLGLERAPGQVPRLWHADLTTGTGRCAPDPTGRAVTAQLRYRFVPAEPSDEPNDVPWFPWDRYLVQAIFVDALRHEQDSRADTEEMKLEAQFTRIRRSAVPLRSQSLTIPHDPSVFTTPPRF